MGIHPVRGNPGEDLRGDVKPALRHQEHLPDRLRHGGFSAPVCAGQQVNPSLPVKAKIIPDRCSRRFHQGQLQIVKAPGLHPLRIVFRLQRLRPAEDPAFLPELFPVFRPPDVIDQLRNQIRNLPDAHRRIPVQHLPQLSHQAGKQVRQRRIHRPGQLPGAVRVRHMRHGHGQQRIPHPGRGSRQLVHPGAQKGAAAVRRLPGHGAVPLLGGLHLIAPHQRPGKMLQQAGPGKGLAVDGNQPSLHRFKPLVQVQPDGDALHAVRRRPQGGDILLQPLEPAVLPDRVNAPAQLPQPLGLQAPVLQAVLHRLHRGDIVPQLIQPVDQIPDTDAFLRGPARGSEIVQKFHMVQQRQQLFPDFRMMEKIVKDLRPVSGHPGVRCQAAEHLQDHGLLLRIRRHPLADRVHAQIMQRFLRHRLINDMLLIRKQDGQLCSVPSHGFLLSVRAALRPAVRPAPSTRFPGGPFPSRSSPQAAGGPGSSKYRVKCCAHYTPEPGLCKARFLIPKPPEKGAVP